MVIAVGTGARAPETSYALQAVTPSDLDWIAEAVFRWPSTYRWSLRGLTPSPEAMHHALWDGVAVQYTLVDADRRPAGVVQVHQIELQSSFGYVSMLVAPAPRGGPDPLGPAVESLMRQVFRDFPLRRLYIEVLEGEVAETVRRVPLAFVEEARLRDHERVGPGAYDDLVFFTLEAPQ